MKKTTAANTSSPKSILVTGGSSGIGLSIAKYLSDKGFVVFGTSRKAKNGEKLENFTLVNMDVTSEESISEAIDYILKNNGPIDVLVNNAGLGIAGPLENTSDEEAKKVFETNVFGVLNVCRACIPILRDNGGGNIINVTSIGGIVGLPFRGIYCSSKFAVEGITETLSMELRAFNIHVSIIEPGDFKTNINQNRLVSKDIDTLNYDGTFEETLNQINSEVAGARDPIYIARQVHRIIKSKNPRLRYKVATPTQRLSVFLKRILPGRLFEKMLMKHYHLD
ncbi:SDR family oxidoreductase [Halocola ammonii]